MNVIYDGQIAVVGIKDSALLVRNHIAHSEIIYRHAVQVERQGFPDDSHLLVARIDVVPICRMVCQQLDGVAVLRRIQRRREGFVCAAVHSVRFCYRSGLNDSLVDCEFHGCRPILLVVLCLGGLGVDIICAGVADCGVFIDLGHGFAALVLRRSSYWFVLRIVICHRSTLRRTLDRQQRQNLFARRASRLGKRYGQIGIGLVDVAADRKRFFARLELVLCRRITDQLDFHSDGMPSRVRGIKRLLGGKARSFCEFKRICAVCKPQVD